LERGRERGNEGWETFFFLFFLEQEDGDLFEFEFGSRSRWGNGSLNEMRLFKEKRFKYLVLGF